MIRRFIAKTFWALGPWTLKSEEPPHYPSIYVAAPHTSNWDFILMLAVAWYCRVDMMWMGKKSLFEGWGGPIMRKLHGLPVDRENPKAVVDEIVARVDEAKTAGLVIAPDGSRGKNPYWKSGFYRIAQKTGMPVTLAYVDRPTKTVGLGPTFELTGNVGEDMDRIRAFFADKHGFRPENRVEPRLRMEENG
ncbi:MAG TPA: 1-acyl-sn-glycerol-3-phosphate acyltransferase [Candidatus Corynebacterium gallistercoris]|uniref:1-acyl-sn-glycerol-3-phosphate acyltransferase n=1 Tax=Candidatus Corynebacterium gallistercoris TaxID=2838530 RepID=A0A9D1RZQ0_9CORY|nr:1-acyl-sn-glycerol-3-phosphate acyltransferase [Candidatus Corynebacterium gallistercoris]